MLLESKSVNGFIYHVNVFKRRHATLVAKLVDLGMGTDEAKEIASAHLTYGKPLPIFCSACCEFNHDPGTPICPNCLSTHTINIKLQRR